MSSGYHRENIPENIFKKIRATLKSCPFASLNISSFYFFKSIKGDTNTPQKKLSSQNRRKNSGQSLSQTLSRVYDSALFWVVEPLELSTQYLLGLSHTQRFSFFYAQLEEILFLVKYYSNVYTAVHCSALSLIRLSTFLPCGDFIFFLNKNYYCISYSCFSCVCHHLES